MATKNFRTELSRWLRKRQKYRCSYCLLLTGELGRRSHHLDHFVPKGKKKGTPEWTFETLNLIFVCEYCNTKKKKTFDPLIRKASSYRRSEYAIVHPYLDRPEEHFKGGYLRGDRPPTVPEGISDKGTATIRLFGLAEPAVQELWQQDYEQLQLKRNRAALQHEDQVTLRLILDELT